MRPLRGAVLAFATVLAVLVVATGPASASDVGLRALAADAVRTDERIDRRFAAVPERTGGQASLARYLRRRAAVARSAVRRLGAVRRRVVQEAPETAGVTAGRDLLLRGLRDESTAYRRFDVVLRAFARAALAARSREAFDRAVRRYQRQERAVFRLGKRGEDRIARGRKRIDEAPPGTVT